MKQQDSRGRASTIWTLREYKPKFFDIQIPIYKIRLLHWESVNQCNPCRLPQESSTISHLERTDRLKGNERSKNEIVNCKSHSFVEKMIIISHIIHANYNLQKFWISDRANNWLHIIEKRVLFYSDTLTPRHIMVLCCVDFESCWTCKHLAAHRTSRTKRRFDWLVRPRNTSFNTRRCKIVTRL